MKYTVAILLFVFSCLAQASVVYTVETVPRLGIVNKSYIVDPGHFLKDATIQTINKELMVLEQITSDQIGIVVLPSIGKDSPKPFATALFDRFRIGQKDKDNGLLILLVMDQKRVEFETGYGLEGVLPDAICKRIELEYMVPQFKEKKYDQGILDGLRATIQLLSSPQESALLKADVEEEDVSEPEDSRWIVATFFAVPYVLLLLILFFVKRMKGTFTDDYNKLNEARKRNVILTISKGRWLLFYVLLPLTLFGSVLNLYHGFYLLFLVGAAAYVWILMALIEKKDRSKKFYAASYRAGDYYDQYNKFTQYFDNWGIAAVFFPIPFLFTDYKNNNKLKAIRLHPRDCDNCHLPMTLLDEKKDDEFLQKSQIFEEAIKSVDYDVWLCNHCHTHYALGYNSKFSKYKPCTFCGTKASFLQSDITKVPPSYASTGIGEKTYKCMYCEKVSSEEYSIPMLMSSSDSSDSSSSSSSSSSDSGAGSSGGGGAGSSW
ncbi:MAG: hypothetical protein JWO58_858 [Chitinophagaceae bacterium]|nr:hypothetical protein [Chitinophagaceae bacterium]